MAVGSAMGLVGSSMGFSFFIQLLEASIWPPPLIRVNAGINRKADCLLPRETIFDRAKIMYVVVCDIVEQVAYTKLVKKYYDVVANQCWFKTGFYCRFF